MLSHKYEPDINAEIYEIFKTQNGNFLNPIIYLTFYWV